MLFLTRDRFRCLACGSIDPITYTDRSVCCVVETPLVESEYKQLGFGVYGGVGFGVLPYERT